MSHVKMIFSKTHDILLLLNYLYSTNGEDMIRYYH